MDKPISGILLADKPEGISSQLLVSKVKRILHVRSAGHTGTLDPIATGLNLICYGRATRVSEYLLGCDKEYIAELQIGRETDTGDVTGQTLTESDRRITASELRGILPRFTGDLQQIPPLYSAIKLDGKKLYDLARKGKADVAERALTPRPVRIYEIELLAADEAEQRFTLRVFCSKGTYIRSLCRDMARALNTCGTMSALRRTRVGRFSVEDALTPNEMAERAAKEDFSFIFPVEAVFGDLPAVTLDAYGEERLRHGADVTDDHASAKTAGRCRLMAESGEFLAVGTVENGFVLAEKRFFEVDDQ